MTDWIDASTQTMEAYVKEADGGRAIVFRFKGRGDNYAAYVMPDAERYIAAVAFSSPDVATNWADQQLEGEELRPLEERFVG